MILSRSTFAVGDRSFGERGLAQHHPEGVQGRLAGLDRIEGAPHQLDRRHAAAGKREELIAESGKSSTGGGRCDHQ